MSNPTGEALTKAEAIAAHAAAIAEAEITARCLREASNACLSDQPALKQRLIRAAEVIEHLLPLHRQMIETVKYNATASEALQKVVDYRNKHV